MKDISEDLSQLGQSTNIPSKAPTRSKPGRKGTKGVTMNLDKLTSRIEDGFIELSTRADKEKITKADANTNDVIGIFCF